MNFGLQDAYNLCWKLALVLEQGVDPGILDTYSEERVPVARGVLQLTGRSTQMMAMQNGILIWVRLVARHDSMWKELHADVGAECGRVYKCGVESGYAQLTSIRSGT